jgi:hypothetical protein
MKKILLSILGLMIVGLCDVNSQSKEIILGDTLVIIERLTLTEADDRKVEKIRSAQADNKVSDNWNFDDFRTRDKRLEDDYKRIVAGLKKKGIKYKELTQKEFNEHLTSGDDKVVYLTNDYSVREEKNKYLIITMTFKLLTADKKLLLDEPAKGILKQLRGT